MASIPLPALGVKQPENPLEQVSQAVSVANLLKQQQLLPGQLQMQQQQIKNAALENQQHELALKDQQAATAAMQEWDGKDINALPGLVLKHGGSAQTVMGMKTSIIKQQQDLASLSKDQLANQAAVADQLLGHIDTLKGITDPVQREAASKDQATQILSSPLAKMVDPQTAQMLQGMAQGQFVPSDDQLSLFEKGLTSHGKQIDEALKASEQQKNTSQAAEAQAQTQKIKAEINPENPADPNIQKQKYQDILGKLQQPGGLKNISAADYQWARAYEASQARTSTQADSLGVTSTNTSKPSGLASVGGGKGAGAAGNGAPSGGQSAMGSLVDSIGQYKIDPQLLGRMMYRHPGILGMVSQKYPDFDQTTYAAKNKLIQGYTSGTQAKEINAINTAMGHVKVLDDAVGALNNGDVRLLNAIGNKLGVETGSTPQSTFKLIVNRVGPEIASAYIPGGGGEAERFANEKDFDGNLSPQQLHANAAMTVKLLRSKVGALENQYKNTVGRDDFQQRFITPEAQASFQKFASQGGGGSFSVTAPNGKVYSFKDQASADAFKAKAGIK